MPFYSYYKGGEKNYGKLKIFLYMDWIVRITYRR